ncbi:AI-2E family transporter [Occallatibacter savannae]|uniref:AI-2E family transporter n=1 Tax=Occallatibacter savannae TaxID=1002691 RepID=UPI001EF566E4|nr:AI-2E family transporter [Occallatibacter savannae]
MTETEGTRRDLRGDILFVFALGVLCYLAWMLRHVLLLLFVSALAAVVLTPIVRATSRFRIGNRRPFRGKAILILMLLVVGALTAFGFLAFPPVIRDLNEAGKEMPQRLPVFLEKLKSVPFADQVNTDAVNEKVQDFVSNAATYLLLSIKNWAGAIFSIAMGVILTVYFILEGDIAYRWFLSFFPPGRRARLDAALQRSDIRMGQWLLGQGSLMLILGIASTAVYASLHVRYAYALGVFTGLLNIIPVVGSAISIAVALLVAAVDSWGRVIGVAIFYVIWVQVENSFLIPRIMGTRVGLPGISILVALLIGSELGGVLGAIVSVPTAVLVSVLIDEYLIQKTVDEETETISAKAETG